MSASQWHTYAAAAAGTYILPPAGLSSDQPHLDELLHRREPGRGGGGGSKAPWCRGPGPGRENTLLDIDLPACCIEFNLFELV
jgi:hypothetical protein